MKKNDIALIAVIVIISALVSFFASNMLFATKQDRQQEVEKVDAITAEFAKPKQDDAYFNEKSIDPTQPIQIQENNNANPFNGQTQ